MKDFFRAEVLQAQRREAVGKILLVRPLPTTVLTAAVLVAAVAIGAWLSLGTYTRKAHLDGRLVADGAGSLRAEFFAGAATVRWLRVDQRVLLRLPVDGGPARGSGAIVGIARSPLTAAELGGLPGPIAAHAAREPVYRVVARLDGLPARSASIAAGTVVEADVHVVRKRLIAWMFSARDPAADPV